jgi:hypothetical protein
MTVKKKIMVVVVVVVMIIIAMTEDSLVYDSAVHTPFLL